MKYPVINKFRCRLSRVIYRPGDTYETDNPDRGEELIGKGKVRRPKVEMKPVIATPEPKPEPKHVGGGTYELPDGRRVRGKEAALEAMGKSE